MNVRLPLIILLLTSTGTFGQGKKTFDLNQRIYLANSLRLDSLLKKISRPTGLIFSYNTRKVNHGLPFSFAPGNYSVEELLSKIKEKTGLDYAIEDNYVILKSSRLLASPQKIPVEALKSQSKVGAVKEIAIPQPVEEEPILSIEKKEDKKMTPEVSNSVVHDKPVQEKIENEIPEKVESKVESIANSLVVKTQEAKKDSVIKKEKPATAKLVTLPKKVDKSSSIFFRVGLSGDETLYGGPTLHFGHPRFYAIASYKTDFKLGLVTYGIGSSFALGKSVSLSVQVNIGTLSKYYDTARLAAYDTSGFHRGITAKSNLTRIGFLLEKKINTHFIIQGGLQYNLLTTKFSSTPFSDDRKSLCALSPPYLLTNNYSASGDSNVRNWIGIQINLLYSINFPKKR